ncbi:MAG: hypothetical protein CMF69_04505 [Magnetovibrio sp.]|nr:hypothetical protein [Magnetovibrio sp.]
MTILSPPLNIRTILEGSDLSFEVIPCDADDADTAVFVEKYGYSIEDSANCILVKTKTGDVKFIACVLLATTRLDVNKRVRKKIPARKVSFANAEETRMHTGMELGGVTPIGLPDWLPLWIDSKVMQRNRIIIGGGDRHCKIIVPPGIFEQISNVEIVDKLAVPL